MAGNPSETYTKFLRPWMPARLVIVSTDRVHRELDVVAQRPARSLSAYVWASDELFASLICWSASSRSLMVFVPPPVSSSISSSVPSSSLGSVVKVLRILSDRL